MRNSFKSIETVSLPNPGRGVTGKSEKDNVALGGKKMNSLLVH